MGFEGCFVLGGEVVDVEGAATCEDGVFSEVGVGGEEVEFDEAGEGFGDGVVGGEGGEVELPVLVAVEVVVVGVCDDGLFFSGGEGDAGLWWHGVWSFLCLRVSVEGYDTGSGGVGYIKVCWLGFCCMCCFENDDGDVLSVDAGVEGG